MFHQLLSRPRLTIAVLLVSVAAGSSVMPVSATGQRVRHDFLMWYANADGSYDQAGYAAVTVTAAGATETNTASRKGWITFYVPVGTTNLSVQIAPADPEYCGWSGDIATDGQEHKPAEYHQITLNECRP